jgi:hypothetical protein
MQRAANDWKFITAGNWHSAALKTDNTLWLWGGNDHAQLGDGMANYLEDSPIQIGSNDWRTVSAGAYHNLALKTDGSLWGWGFNNFQQLTSAADPLQTTPLRIGQDNDWAQVAAGGYYSLALKTNGTLWHWGANHHVPVDEPPPVPPTPSPTQVGTDIDWLRLSAGRWHTLAIKQDGSLWAWGRNFEGQLGTGALKTLLAEFVQEPAHGVDSWLRRKVRAYYWKQWGRARTRRRKLLALGIGRHEVKLASRSRKGPWRMSHNSIVQRALTDRWLAAQGVPSIREQWIAIRYPNPVT